MGVVVTHVVMVGIEIDPTEEFEEELTRDYPFRGASPGDLVYCADHMSNEYKVFGKILEIAEEHEGLSFQFRHISPSDKQEVFNKVNELTDIHNALPLLYVFTHYS